MGGQLWALAGVGKSRAQREGAGRASRSSDEAGGWRSAQLSVYLGSSLSLPVLFHPFEKGSYPMAPP